MRRLYGKNHFFGKSKKIVNKSVIHDKALDLTGGSLLQDIITPAMHTMPAKKPAVVPIQPKKLVSL